MIWILARGALFFGQEFISVLSRCALAAHKAKKEKTSLQKGSKKIINVYSFHSLNNACDLNATWLLPEFTIFLFNGFLLI
jgi:hypothetical protein